MKRFIRTAAAALLTAGTLASAPAAHAQQARQILYRVDGPSGATVYMLGSIHLLTADAYPLAQAVEEAYSDAERVWFEVNLDSLTARAAEIMPKALFQDGQTLRTAIPADLYAKVAEAAAPYAAQGVSMEVLERFEPWMVGMFLSQLEWAKAGLQPEFGIDMHFQQRARSDAKPVGAFETVDFQLGLMDGFTPEQQMAFLRQTLDELPRTGEMMNGMVAAWRAGDTVALDSLVNGSMGEYPELHAAMLINRNTSWVPQIEQLLRGTDDVLVVVGAAHLIGDESVVEMLRERGYTVEQI